VCLGWEGSGVPYSPSGLREDGTAGLTGPAVLFGFGVGMLGGGLNKLQSESLFEVVATGSRSPVKTCVHACSLCSCHAEPRLGQGYLAGGVAGFMPDFDNLCQRQARKRRLPLSDRGNLDWLVSISSLIDALGSFPGKDPGRGSKLAALAIEFPRGDESGELSANGRIGFVVGIEANEHVVRAGSLDQLVLGATDSAGGDRAHVRPETDESFAFERAFSNDDIGACRQ